MLKMCTGNTYRNLFYGSNSGNVLLRVQVADLRCQRGESQTTQKPVPPLPGQRQEVGVAIWKKPELHRPLGQPQSSLYHC